MNTSLRRFKFKKTLIGLVSVIFYSGPIFSQSFAYKTLLNSLYESDFPVLKPQEINTLSAFQILDTREKEEFEVSHLSGAIWVGYESFSLKRVEDLDKSKPVLVYCTLGARSQAIGKKLQEAGFKQVYNLYGGIIHWSNETMPLESKGMPTQKVHTYSRTWGVWLNKGEKVY